MALSLDTIDRALIKSDGGGLPNNLIAIAVMINDKGEGQHSGLIIGVEGEYHIFHYTGSSVELEPIPANEWYYHNQLEILEPEDSLSFLHLCQMILRTAKPFYGFVFDGSFYKEGEYISQSGLPEMATCVSFCINVISSFLVHNDTYFAVEDWQSDEKSTAYFEQWQIRAKAKNPAIDLSSFKKHWRRITPSEYTASSFLAKVPVRKAEIDKIIKNVETAIRLKRPPAISA